MRVDALKTDLHFAIACRELHRIREEIPDHLLQPVCVAGHVAGVRIEDRVEPHTSRVRGGTDDLYRPADHINEVDRLYVEAKFASVNAGKVEDVLDEAALRAGVASDGVVRLGEHGGIRFAFEQLNPSDDAGQRRAQLVRDGGEKLVASACGAFRRRKCALQLRTSYVELRGQLRALGRRLPGKPFLCFGAAQRCLAPRERAEQRQ